MCGIAGFVDPGDKLRGESTLRSLAVSLAHRGPDGEGAFLEGPFGLVHRRLAIIDLTETGAQPLRVEHIVMVFNGEIYNYRELRVELAALGRKFVGTSDTEVLAQAFLQWGIGCVERLRGMWAFAVFDYQTRTITCSRDPFGIKPFYYAFLRGAFVFASEPQALISIGVPARAQGDVIAQYIALGLTDHSPQSFFAGIRRLGAGETLVVDRAAKAKSVATLDAYSVAASATCSEAGFAACLRESVRLHLRSDVPVGTCLSGGLDSSTVAALASREARSSDTADFHAITGSSGEAATEERNWAKLVVEHCRLLWRVVQPTGREFSEEVEECLRMQGEPTLSPSVYFQYRVMREARSAGLKVMLDGQGADEILCGYERYVPVHVREVARSSGIARAAREYFALSRGSRPGVSGMTALSAYVLFERIRRRSVLSRLQSMRREYVDCVREIVRDISADNRDILSARIGDLARYSLPALLRYEDRNSMAHSIEARVPYVDKELVSCALALPRQGLFHQGYSKHALREVAAAVLPASVAWRKSKVGFEPPTDTWLRAIDDRIQREVPGSSVLRRLFRNPPALSRLPAALRWRFYNVSVWERIFSVSEA